jgi:hypothetical protein
VGTGNGLLIDPGHGFKVPMAALAVQFINRHDSLLPFFTSESDIRAKLHFLDYPFYLSVLQSV